MAREFVRDARKLPHVARALEDDFLWHAVAGHESDTLCYSPDGQEAMDEAWMTAACVSRHALNYVSIPNQESPESRDSQERQESQVESQDQESHESHESPGSHNESRESRKRRKRRETTRRAHP